LVRSSFSPCKSKDYLYIFKKLSIDLQELYNILNANNLLSSDKLAPDPSLH
jgi:hypothetical protein